VENAGALREGEIAKKKPNRAVLKNPVKNACGAVPERKWVVGGYRGNATCASFRFRPQAVTSAASLIGSGGW